MKKIILLGFGGTIAMVPNKHGVLAPAKTAEELLQYVPHVREVADIEVIQLENLDSTNINPTHWVKLARKIHELSDKCDGIIVTHGTDTMAYTASAVALAMAGCSRVPVVFTGSQLPIVDVGNDARFNLENSVKAVIKASDIGLSEVMIVFGDRVLRAARSIKTSESHFDAFDSPAFPYLAQITATGVEFTPISFAQRTTNSNQLQATFDSNIFTIDVSPGLKPDLLLTLLSSSKCSALLLRSLGAGYVPTLGKYSLLPVINEATKLDIPVLISTKFIGGRTLPDLYEVGKLAGDAGAIPTGNMTDVMAQVKLMWLLAQGMTSQDELARSMLRSYVGEVD